MNWHGPCIESARNRRSRKRYNSKETIFCQFCGKLIKLNQVYYHQGSSKHYSHIWCLCKIEKKDQNERT